MSASYPISVVSHRYLCLNTYKETCCLLSSSSSQVLYSIQKIQVTFCQVLTNVYPLIYSSK